MKLFGFLAALVVLTSFVAGQTLFSASNHVDVTSNRDGQLTFWFTPSESGDYAINTEGSIATRVTPSFGTMDAGAVKSFTVTFLPVLCSKGLFYTTINLDTVTSAGISQRTSKTVEVDVQQSIDCLPVVQNSLPQDVPSQANAFGSTLSLASQFDASDVNLVIYAPEGQTDIANGETRQINLDIVNRGATGEFLLSAIGAVELNPILNDYAFVLQRGESKRVTLTVSPRDLQGTQWVSIQATRSGQVAAVKDIFFEVGKTHSVELVMPQVVNTKNCGIVTIAGTIKNPGSAVETLTVSIPSLFVSSNTLTLAPRSEQNFVLNLDLSSLSAQDRVIDVVASNQYVSTKQPVQFNIAECDSTGVVSYSVQVDNPSNQTLVGVYATVVDVPNNWKVSTSMPIDIPANSSRNLTASIQPVGAVTSEIAPTLLVRDANGNVLKTQKLSPVKPSSTTGLFLAGLLDLSGLEWIGAIVFVALIIAIFSAKATLRRSTA